MRAHISTAEVPILGSVTCNTLIFPQLRAALQEIVDVGLADEIHPAEYAGCYYPRFIAGTTKLSNHAFGLALDLNVPGNQRGTVGEMDRGVVAVFESGASPGAATGATPTRCTSRPTRSSTRADASLVEEDAQQPCTKPR